MAFQIKRFIDIVAGMINRMSTTQTVITDFNVGAVARTLVEAPAQEMDELYQQMLQGIINGIATGTFTTFSFPPLAPQAASGPIVVTIAAQTTATLIPAGTVFTANNSGAAEFASSVDATIPIGQTNISVPVVASQAGSASSVGVGTTFSMSVPPPGFVSAIAQVALTGTDAETTAGQTLRFQQYIAALARSTIDGVQYGAETAFVTDSLGNIIEKVQSAVVVEPWLTDDTQPPGLMNIYIFNGAGGTSSALVAQCQQVINGYYNAAGQRVPGYKAAGTVAVVYAAPQQNINVTGTCTVGPGYVEATVAAQVSSAIYGYILGLPLNGGIYEQAAVYALAMGVPGMTNFVMTVGNADVTAAAGTKLYPGTLAIT